MGGCYSSNYSSPRCAPARPAKPKWETQLRKFVKSHEIEDLILAHDEFFDESTSGLFAKLAEFSGIATVLEIPKEFPEFEYEVKFDVAVNGKGKEPTMEQYLDALDFPASKNARFLKDPVNSIAEGKNHFYGDGSDEKLVVIEKGGGTFLKEKGIVETLSLGIPFQEIVIKRKEERYETNLEEILRKTKEVLSQKGVVYRGYIRKEKGDAFILDADDGRLYSMSFTRSHLNGNGNGNKSDNGNTLVAGGLNGTQRQFEFEYAGYIPGFEGFKKDSEKQVVQGMIDLAKYTWAMYGDKVRIAKGWNAKLSLTGERKYDFVSQDSEGVRSLGDRRLIALDTKVLETAGRSLKNE